MILKRLFTLCTLGLLLLSAETFASSSERVFEHTLSTEDKKSTENSGEEKKAKENSGETEKKEETTQNQETSLPEESLEENTNSSCKYNFLFYFIYKVKYDNDNLEGSVDALNVEF